MALSGCASGIHRRFLIVASSGGGGDLQPLLALASGLRARGHGVSAFGDTEVQIRMHKLGVETTLAGDRHDLSLQYAAAARHEGHLSPVEQAASLRDRLSSDWAPGLRPLIEGTATADHSDILVASLFSAGPVRLAAESAGLPWVAVNSTFYVGPGPPRSPEEDFGSRAPLFSGYFGTNMDEADRVLHASDRVFDFGFGGLPAHHHYVGPLLEDTLGDYPSWLDEPGNPWALVTVSSLKQDDIAIARAALAGLSTLPLRVLVTAGPHAAQALGELPQNARVEQYVQHGPVLTKARLMVSHAGHGSVMRALWHGVPMVLVPWGRDQGGVADRAAHLGVAKVIAKADVSAKRMADAARSALGDDAMAAKIAIVSLRLRAMDPVHTACGLIAQPARNRNVRTSGMPAANPN
jgi:UDP:flavonoid glycosyltransferase YjiC (YdhE family)